MMKVQGLSDKQEAAGWAGTFDRSLRAGLLNGYVDLGAYISADIYAAVAAGLDRIEGPVIKIEKADPSMRCGTYLLGYLPTTFAVLTAAFGDPLSGSGDGKVRAQWVLKTIRGGGLRTVVFTIYDYKETGPVGSVVNWHVGGHIENVSDVAEALLAKGLRFERR
jgi:hypothetical protein